MCIDTVNSQVVCQEIKQLVSDICQDSHLFSCYGKSIRTCQCVKVVMAKSDAVRWTSGATGRHVTTVRRCSCDYLIVKIRQEPLDVCKSSCTKVIRLKKSVTTGQNRKLTPVE